MIIVLNITKKDPNELHDFLLINNIKVLLFQHDRKYNEFGEVENEATEFYIEVMDEDLEAANQKINEFMSH
ncbi:hypothetical protein [Paenibacillus naphthalenovorans]|uniref:hypothetical protein n=1 Tax=Paenibacillus naphthalenovorans TaxID=162209 RepID=UPI003D27D0CB